VRNFIIFDGVYKKRSDLLLAAHIAERRKTVFPVKNFSGFTFASGGWHGFVPFYAIRHFISSLTGLLGIKYKGQELSYPVAPEMRYLPLLLSRPGGVRKTSPHRTQPSPHI